MLDMPWYLIARGWAFPSPKIHCDCLLSTFYFLSFFFYTHYTFLSGNLGRLTWVRLQQPQEQRDCMVTYSASQDSCWQLEVREARASGTVPLRHRVFLWHCGIYADRQWKYSHAGNTVCLQCPSLYLSDFLYVWLVCFWLPSDCISDYLTTELHPHWAKENNFYQMWLTKVVASRFCHFWHHFGAVGKYPKCSWILMLESS